jgi:hypothetical protein
MCMCMCVCVCVDVWMCVCVCVCVCVLNACLRRFSGSHRGVLVFKHRTLHSRILAVRVWTIFSAHTHTYTHDTYTHKYTHGTHSYTHDTHTTHTRTHTHRRVTKEFGRLVVCTFAGPFVHGVVAYRWVCMVLPCSRTLRRVEMLLLHDIDLPVSDCLNT